MAGQDGILSSACVLTRVLELMMGMAGWLGLGLALEIPMICT